MKRKECWMCIICSLSVLLLIMVVMGYWWKGKMSKLYEEYRYPNEEFYGKELYAEIDHECSGHELEIGNEIINKGLEVLRYAGLEQDVETSIGDVGALSKYFYFNRENSVVQEGNFQFVTCKVSENKGHVWVVCTYKGYDENGKQVNSSSDVLALWYVEKQGDEWCVVKIREAP